MKSSQAHHMGDCRYSPWSPERFAEIRSRVGIAKKTIVRNRTMVTNKRKIMMNLDVGYDQAAFLTAGAAFFTFGNLRASSMNSALILPKASRSLVTCSLTFLATALRSST